MSHKVGVVVGGLLIVVGAVWFGQGMGWIGGGMSGVTLWAIVGPLVVLVGITVILWVSRGRTGGPVGRHRAP